MDQLKTGRAGWVEMVDSRQMKVLPPWSPTRGSRTPPGGVAVVARERETGAALVSTDIWDVLRISIECVI